MENNYDIILLEQKPEYLTNKIFLWGLLTFQKLDSIKLRQKWLDISNTVYSKLKETHETIADLIPFLDSSDNFYLKENLVLQKEKGSELSNFIVAIRDLDDLKALVMFYSESSLNIFFIKKEFVSKIDYNEIKKLSLEDVPKKANFIDVIIRISYPLANQMHIFYNSNILTFDINSQNDNSIKLSNLINNLKVLIPLDGIKMANQ